MWPPRRTSRPGRNHHSRPGRDHRYSQPGRDRLGLHRGLLQLRRAGAYQELRGRRWTIRPDHGQELIRVYGGPADDVGDRALAVAKHWNTICYIGRGNPFNNPDFVFEYWRDQSDFFNTPWPPLAPACDGYNFNTLRVENMGGGLGWRVTDGSKDLQHFASQQDANNGRTVLTKVDELCNIRSETPSPDVKPADITFNLHL